MIWRSGDCHEAQADSYPNCRGDPAFHEGIAYLESVTHLQALWSSEQLLYLVMRSPRGFETLAATTVHQV
jgi:hypothetical protein